MSCPQRTRVALAAATLAALAGCPASAGQPTAPSPPSWGSAKRALIVAVAEYAPGTGWARTSADNDLGHLRRLFAEQGFSDVHELRDAEATRDGIVRAFRDQLLTPARPGDLTVFYYAGHGQQLTDDGDDEIDGYDEALVPFDAPDSLIDGYSGERHLRDDALHGLFLEARRKLGASGHLVVFLDYCFSGPPRASVPVDGISGDLTLVDGHRDVAVTACEMFEKAVHPALLRKRRLLPLESPEEDPDQLVLLLLAHFELSFPAGTGREPAALNRIFGARFPGPGPAGAAALQALRPLGVDPVRAESSDQPPRADGGLPRGAVDDLGRGEPALASGQAVAADLRVDAEAPAEVAVAVNRLARRLVVDEADAAVRQTDDAVDDLAQPESAVGGPAHRTRWGHGRRT